MVVAALACRRRRSRAQEREVPSRLVFSYCSTLRPWPSGLVSILAGDAALAGPDNGGCAPIDPDLAIERRKVVADGVAREVQTFTHVQVGLTLADKAKDVAPTIRQVLQISAQCRRARSLTQRGQFFHDAATEPRSIGHYGFDRRHPFVQGSLAVGDVQDAKDAAFIMNCDGVCRKRAVDERVRCRRRCNNVDLLPAAGGQGGPTISPR